MMKTSLLARNAPEDRGTKVCSAGLVRKSSQRLRFVELLRRRSACSSCLGLLLGYCTWYYGVFFAMLPEHITFLSRLVFTFPVFVTLQQVVSCCGGMHHNQSGSGSAFSAARSGTESSSGRHTEDKQQKQSKERRAAACAPS